MLDWRILPIPVIMYQLIPSDVGMLVVIADCLVDSQNKFDYTISA